MKSDHHKGWIVPEPLAVPVSQRIKPWSEEEVVLQTSVEEQTL
jgi:hypothetical protein